MLHVQSHCCKCYAVLILVQAGRQHVMLCAAPGSTLQQEMQLLSQASELLADSGKQHLAVFAVDPAEQVSPTGTPFLLLGWRQKISIWDLRAWCLPAWSGVAAPLRIRAFCCERWLQRACQAAALLFQQSAAPMLVVLLTCHVLSVFPGCGGPAALTAAAGTTHPHVRLEPSWPQWGWQ